jgi:hypothetical protein
MCKYAKRCCSEVNENIFGRKSSGNLGKRFQRDVWPDHPCYSNDRICNVRVRDSISRATVPKRHINNKCTSVGEFNPARMTRLIG